MKKRNIIFIVIFSLFICGFTSQNVHADVVRTDGTQADNMQEEHQSVPSIQLKKTKISLERGQKAKLKAVLKNAAGKKIIWKSSKKKVATVSKKGKVTAKNKGKATITARIKGTNISAKCVVVVKNYVTMKVKTTGYCNCSRCAGKWAGAPTASGTRPRQNRTIAVDKRLIKLGTKVQIGNEMYVAEDTGGAIKGKKIDIYYSSHRKAQAHGVQYKKIKVYI